MENLRKKLTDFYMDVNSRVQEMDDKLRRAATLRSIVLKTEDLQVLHTACCVEMWSSTGRYSPVRMLILAEPCSTDLHQTHSLYKTPPS